MINKQYLDALVEVCYQSLKTYAGISKFNPASSSAPNRYKEIIYKVYDPPINFYAHIELNPAEVKLEELGWQKDDVEVIVRASFSELRRVGLVDNFNQFTFNVDDRLVIFGKEYDICKIEGKTYIDGVPTLVWIGGRTPNGRAT